MEAISICRICHESKSTKPISDLDQDVLKYVFSNVDYKEHNISMCSNCFENIQALFDFKKSCLDMNSSVKSVYNISKYETGVKIENLDVKTEEPEALSICSICFQIQKDPATSVVSISESNVSQMVNRCLPELNMDENPVSCEKCFRVLEQYFSVLRCLEHENVKCEPVYDEEEAAEETAVSFENLKQEELELKDEQQDSNTQDYLEANFDKRSNPFLLSKEYRQDKDELLLEEKQLLENIDGTHETESFKPFSCDICEKSFKEESGLKTHMPIHSGEDLFDCEICKKQFTKKSEVEIHMRKHTGETPFSCDTCKRQFIRRSSLTNHIRMHATEKHYACHLCDKQFALTKTLKNHMKSHFECNICQKQLSRKESLTTHMRLHTGEKPYVCHICNKQFTLKTSLQYHIKSHTEGMLFECDRCKKQFMKKCHVTVHMRKHTGEKPYSCDTCKKQFARIDSLTTHLKIHTGEKPFACDICQKQFAFKSYVKSHIRKVHAGENIFVSDKWKTEPEDL